jgi:LmbE family N-acetylglucosaminyl deacetylase
VSAGDEEGRSPALQALMQLADSRRPAIDARRWRIVVAHPDDESLGLGAQLHRLRGARLIMVTDGAPADGADARAAGLSSPLAYAEARREELAAALLAGRVMDLAVVHLGIRDQEVADRLAEVARQVQAELEGSEVVITHAHEGGHPDHDATAFAVQRAVARLPEPRPVILEMPAYRLGPNGEMLVQDFAPEPGNLPVQFALTPDERERKMRMLAAHRSQRDVLALFREPTETLRVAPRYDFSILPNGGRLWYAQRGWGWDGERWLAAVERADRDLAEVAPP